MIGKLLKETLQNQKQEQEDARIKEISKQREKEKKEQQRIDKVFTDLITKILFEFETIIDNNKTVRFDENGIGEITNTKTIANQYLISNMSREELFEYFSSKTEVSIDLVHQHQKSFEEKEIPELFIDYQHDGTGQNSWAGVFIKI